MPGRKHTFASFLFIFFIFLGSASFAQSVGYIAVGDSAYTDGYIRFNYKKPTEVEFRATPGSTPTTYTVEQLSGFGIHDSTKFEVQQVNYQGKSEKVFIQVIADGKLKLYLLRTQDGKQFYIQKDALVQLEKESLQQELAPYAGNCPNIEWQRARVKLTSQSLANYGRSINTGNCKPIPLSSFGIMAGVNQNSLQFSKNAYTGNMFGKYSIATTGFEVGLFAEKPLWVVNNLYFTTQLSYNKMSFDDTRSTETAEASYEQKIKLDLDHLTFNILPKYYIHANKVGLFVEAGPELFYLIKQSGKLNQDRYGKSGNEFKEVDNFYEMESLQYGLTAGAGVLYFYAPKKYVSLGLNGSQTYGSEHTITSFTTSLRFNL